MKYLKKFEDLDSKIFKEGDYVFLNLKEVEDNIDWSSWEDSWFVPDDSMFKIEHAYKDSDDEYRYWGKFYDGREFSVVNSEIIRLLTPEEIQEFEIKEQMNKYNV